VRLLWKRAKFNISGMFVTRYLPTKVINILHLITHGCGDIITGFSYKLESIITDKHTMPSRCESTSSVRLSRILLLTYEWRQVELDSRYPYRVTAINPVSSMTVFALSVIFRGNWVRTINVHVDREASGSESVSPTTRLLNTTCLVWRS